LYRPEAGHEPMYVNDDNIIAVATDVSLQGQTQTALPVLDINNAGQIAEFIRLQFLAEHHPS